jgi:hypothetical protein
MNPSATKQCLLQLCTVLGTSASERLKCDVTRAKTRFRLSAKRTCPFNLYAPRILYIGQTYRSSPEYAFYIFSQQIYLIFFFRLSLTIFVYSSTKCRVFPNVTLLGS